MKYKYIIIIAVITIISYLTILSSVKFNQLLIKSAEDFIPGLVLSTICRKDEAYHKVCKQNIQSEDQGRISTEDFYNSQDYDVIMLYHHFSIIDTQKLFKYMEIHTIPNIKSKLNILTKEEKLTLVSGTLQEIKEIDRDAKLTRGRTGRMFSNTQHFKNPKFEGCWYDEQEKKYCPGGGCYDNYQCNEESSGRNYRQKMLYRANKFIPGLGVRTIKQLQQYKLELEGNK